MWTWENLFGSKLFLKPNNLFGGNILLALQLRISSSILNLYQGESNIPIFLFYYARYLFTYFLCPCFFKFLCVPLFLLIRNLLIHTLSSLSIVVAWNFLASSSSSFQDSNFFSRKKIILLNIKSFLLLTYSYYPFQMRSLGPFILLKLMFLFISWSYLSYFFLEFQISLLYIRALLKLHFSSPYYFSSTNTLWCHHTNTSCSPNNFNINVHVDNESWDLRWEDIITIGYDDMKYKKYN